MNDLSPSQHPSEDRQGPHNIDAEQALLGAILTNNEVVGAIAPFDAAWIFDQLHRQIYVIATQTIAAGRKANPITLQPFFEAHAPIEEDLTVQQYLGRLSASHLALAMDAQDYAKQIRECFALRQLLSLGREIIASSEQAVAGLPSSQILKQIEERLDPLRDRSTDHRSFIQGDTAIEGAIDDANEAYRNGGGLLGVTTGLASLDEHLGGLMPEELIVLGGATSSGKSSLGLCIALAAVKQNVGVGFFTLEMGAKQLARRILAIETGVSPAAQRRGAFDENDMRRMCGGFQTYKGKPLYINDSSGLTITQLAAEARRLCRTRPIGLLVVDYLQLLKGTDYRGVNRTNEVADISQGLKGLAKELGVPVLALAQLSRKVDERAEDAKRPIMADLREGGSIEHDADVVMFVHREEYWLARRRPDAGNMTLMSEWQQKMEAAAGKAEVIIAKFRDGDLGRVELAFDASRTLFTDRG
jgi:replicative DNA helicase